MRELNAVMIIPTGIGCKIGGHSGDATCAARLLAAACDALIVHPNVVNASDLNAMTDNMLYVEGSMLDRFLAGHINLERVHSNKILVVCNDIKHSIDPVNAARSVLGLDIEILELTTPLEMCGWVENDLAVGSIEGIEELNRAVAERSFDALAVHTPICVDRETVEVYYNERGVNPWGGIEAELSKQLAEGFQKPVAHAPFDQDDMKDLKLHDFPELAPEANGSHLVSVLKGLSQAPRIADFRATGPNILSAEDIDALVTPLCWGEPHNLCDGAGIPIIAVRENTTTQAWEGEAGEAIEVRSYLEAAGYLLAMRMGICINSFDRPLPPPIIKRGI